MLRLSAISHWSLSLSLSLSSTHITLLSLSLCVCVRYARAGCYGFLYVMHFDSDFVCMFLCWFYHIKFRDPFSHKSRHISENVHFFRNKWYNFYHAKNGVKIIALLICIAKILNKNDSYQIQFTIQLMKRILLLDACNFDFFFQWIFSNNKEKKPFALLYDLSTILIHKYTKSLAHATPKMLNDFLFHFVIWNALKTWLNRKSFLSHHCEFFSEWFRKHQKKGS